MAALRDEMALALGLLSRMLSFERVVARAGCLAVVGFGGVAEAHATCRKAAGLMDIGGDLETWRAWGTCDARSNRLHPLFRGPGFQAGSRQAWMR